MNDNHIITNELFDYEKAKESTYFVLFVLNLLYCLLFVNLFFFYCLYLLHISSYQIHWEKIEVSLTLSIFICSLFCATLL